MKTYDLHREPNGMLAPRILTNMAEKMMTNAKPNRGFLYKYFIIENDLSNSIKLILWLILVYLSNSS